jgi:platelet-activating factor acetylhydrolase IB subunit alpha
MDLESRNAQLLEEVSSARANPASTKNSIDWLPRAPAKHTLTGHRSPITKVAFHPLYSVIASASEDASIKVWDWETGEFERTLKGHTKAVQDCDYDSKGLYLVSCSSDLTLKLWDVSNDYNASKTFHGHDHSISSVRFLPGDAQFVSASRDQTLKIWEVATG